MARLVSYFLKGLVFVVPIGATAWLLVAVFSTIDGWLGLPFPGLGVVLVLVLTTLTGFLLSNYLTRRVLSTVERALDRLPFVRLLHSSLKDLMSAFVGERRRFDKPVLVELIPGVRALGFVTNDSLGHLALNDDVAVYLPQAYNFAGQLLIVPRTSLRPIEADSAQIMAFVVSGGVVSQR